MLGGVSCSAAGQRVSSQRRKGSRSGTGSEASRAWVSTSKRWEPYSSFARSIPSARKPALVATEQDAGLLVRWRSSLLVSPTFPTILLSSSTASCREFLGPAAQKLMFWCVSTDRGAAVFPWISAQICVSRFVEKPYMTLTGPYASPSMLIKTKMCRTLWLFEVC